MSDRKLVYKVTVDEILPIEGADKIEVARITGWRVVVQKGEFKAGDTALFFEVDSSISAHDDRFAFLKERCYKKFLDQSRNLFDECLRIKTIKLRGIYSQGLLLPVTQFCEVRNKALGEDCRDVLYVRHYDEVAERAVRETQPFMAANQKGLFPSSFGPKSDEIRCQNLTDEEIKSVLNYEFELTEKRDGSSLSIGYSPTNRPDDPLAVCSRNYELKDMPSAYWDIVHELSLDEKLKKYCDDNSRELLVQGELVGPGIQNNRDHLEKRNLQVFRIWDIKAQAFVQPEERYEICRALGVDHVPVLTRTTLAPYVDPDNPDYMQAVRDNIIKSSDGTTANGNLREGIVFKQADGKGDFHFKAVSNKYLEGLK